jgi:hypothetical protein
MKFFRRARSRAMQFFRNSNVHFEYFCVAHYEVNSTYRTFQTTYEQTRDDDKYARSRGRDQLICPSTRRSISRQHLTRIRDPEAVRDTPISKEAQRRFTLSLAPFEVTKPTASQSKSLRPSHCNTTAVLLLEAGRGTMNIVAASVALLVALACQAGGATAGTTKASAGEKQTVRSGVVSMRTYLSQTNSSSGCNLFLAALLVSSSSPTAGRRRRRPSPGSRDPPEGCRQSPAPAAARRHSQIGAQVREPYCRDW